MSEKGAAQTIVIVSLVVLIVIKPWMLIPLFLLGVVVLAARVVLGTYRILWYGGKTLKKGSKHA